MGEATALKNAVREQLEAQCFVLAPNLDGRNRDPGPASEPYGLLPGLASLTRARLDVVVDGLDEIAEPRRREVLDFLRGLPGSGLCLVGTQPSIPAGYERAGSRIALHPDSDLTMRIIEGFAQQFLGRESLREIGLLLQTRDWREGLARHASGNPWVLTDFLRAVSEQRATWPETPADARLTGDVRVYCREVLGDILAAPEVAASAVELSVLIRGLALLEDRTWPLADLLLLLGQRVGPEDLVRWRQLLLSRAAGRLLGVSAGGGHVRFRDATFQEFLRQDGDDLQRIVAERMVGLLGEAPMPVAAGPSLREDVARLAADHVWRAANGALARRLLLETDWATLRLKTLTDRGWSLTPLLRELRQLLAQIGDITAEERDAVAALDLILATWQGAIEQSGVGAAWWPLLTEAQAWPVWQRQNAAVDPSRPKLLAPAPMEGENRPGYRVPSRIVETLAGPACELPTESSGTVEALVLATETGRLLVLDYDVVDKRYGIPRPFFLGLKTIREVGALGPDRVLVFGRDAEDAPCLIEVGLGGRYVRPWGPGRDAAGLVACAVLERSEEGHEPLVLLGWQKREHSRLSVWRNGMELTSAELPFKGQWWLLGLTACTWAVWGKAPVQEGEAELRLRFRMQAFRARQISEITDRAMSDLTFEPRDHVIAGPEGQAALFYHDGEDAGVLVFRGDGHMPIGPAKLHGVKNPAITGEGEYQAVWYTDVVPVVWHDELGLVFRRDAEFFTFRPNPEALPHDSPRSWQPFPNEEMFMGRGRRLSKGRVLLLVYNCGVVIGADGQTITPVGRDSLEPGGPRYRRRISAIFLDGSVELEEWFPGEPSAMLFRPTLSGLVTASPGKPNPDRCFGLPVRVAFPHKERMGSDGTRFRVEKEEVEQEDLTVLEGDEKIRVSLKEVYQDLNSREPTYAMRHVTQLSRWTRYALCRPMLFDLRKGPPGEWRLCAGYIDQSNRPMVCFRDYKLSTEGQQCCPEGPFREAVLRDETIIAGAAVDRDHVAIAYVSGRIEVVCLREGGSVTAVGFTLSTPQDLAVSRGPAGAFLVVVSDGVSWFKLEDWT